MDQTNAVGVIQGIAIADAPLFFANADMFRERILDGFRGGGVDVRDGLRGDHDPRHPSR